MSIRPTAGAAIAGGRPSMAARAKHWIKVLLARNFINPERFDPSIGNLPLRHNPLSTRWGSGNKRYHRIVNGKRVMVGPGSPRPAVPFVQSAQLGMHWEKGQLVRPAGKPKPSAKACRKRWEKLRMRFKQTPAKPLPPGTRVASPAIATARAERRSGKISARQQRKLRRIQRRAASGATQA